MKSEFVIPELPKGRLLEIKVFSNWGDKQYVGLNGIELFDSSGSVVDIEKVNCIFFRVPYLTYRFILLSVCQDRYNFFRVCRYIVVREDPYA